MEQMDFLSGLSFFIPLGLFIALLTVVLTKRKGKPVDVDSLIKQWNPEPLVETPGEDRSLSNKYIIENKSGYQIFINNVPCVNFATTNFLSLVENARIEQAAKKCIQDYGVGSCGPRGFYGTNVVHLDLEKDISNFMGLEETALYSFGFSTQASAMAAYMKKNDAVFVDESINFAIQTGLIASRCKVQYFKHNNMEHLETLLKKQNELDLTNKKSTKKFIIVEGIYSTTGNICPLKDVLHLRHKYQARIFLDESLSVGVLGATGRGVTEYFDVSTEEVDMIIGSLEHALGSVGGFCVGSSFIIEHHILSGSGYCFSAALAPYLAVAANTSLTILKENPSLLVKLKNNCNLMHSLLSEPHVAERFLLQGHRDTPIKYLHLQDCESTSESKALENISDLCIQSGYAVSCPKYLDKEAKKPRPSIKVTCNVSQTETDMRHLIRILCKSHDTVVKSKL